MQNVITQTITDMINEYVSNPWRFFETRKHHERVLHYLQHDFFVINNNESKYVFRWEFPTHQLYKKQKIGNLSTKKLYIDKNGEPGYIDVVVKDSNDTNQDIDYGFEYGLFECDGNDNEFKIKIENDILKLTDPVNSIKNMFLIYFFRCNDFDRANKTNVKERINTVINRSEKLSSIMLEICNNAETDALKAIFVEIFSINNNICYDNKLNEWNYKIVENTKTRIFSKIKVIK
ncbi:MAG TPA: hypothetical protein VIO58_04900 [Candidatus Methanoperedens sp.]